MTQGKERHTSAPHRLPWICHIENAHICAVSCVCLVDDKTPSQKTKRAQRAEFRANKWVVGTVAGK